MSTAGSGITLDLDSATALQFATVNFSAADTVVLNNATGATIAGLTGTTGTVEPRATAGNYTLTINESGSPAYSGTLVNNTGVLAVTLTGTGTQTFSGANSYSGGTIVNAGTLTGSGTSPLGATTGTLQVNNPNVGAGTAVVLNLSTTAATTTGSLSGTIATPSSGTNTATINNGGQLFTVNQTAAGTYAGVIAGTGGFTLGTLSTNTLILSAPILIPAPRRSTPARSRRAWCRWPAPAVHLASTRP